jgi:predicted nucleic acid-binding protein
VKTYVDSGVLVKLYSWEILSEVAAKLVADLSGVPLVALHELEIRNALRAQQGRGVITEKQLREALRAFESDVREHRLVRVQVGWSEVFLAGERLSRRFTAALLCRSLDILHVAAANQIGCEELITGDSRQARLAEMAGLRSVNIAEGAE